MVTKLHELQAGVASHLAQHSEKLEAAKLEISGPAVLMAGKIPPHADPVGGAATAPAATREMTTHIWIDRGIYAVFWSPV